MISALFKRPAPCLLICVEGSTIRRVNEMSPWNRSFVMKNSSRVFWILPNFHDERTFPGQKRTVAGRQVSRVERTSGLSQRCKESYSFLYSLYVDWRIIEILRWYCFETWTLRHPASVRSIVFDDHVGRCVPCVCFVMQIGRIIFLNCSMALAPLQRLQI